MKYPEHGTISKPVTGEEAKKLLAAIDAGAGVVTEEGKRMIALIVAEHRKRLKEYDEIKEEVRER